MILNYEQKCVIYAIYKNKVFDLPSLVKYIYKNNKELLSPIETDGRSGFKVISNEEYKEKSESINSFIIEDQSKFFTEIDNFFILISLLEEEHLVIKLCNPHHYNEILKEKLTNGNIETCRNSISFGGTYNNKDSSLGTPTFSLVKWKPSLLLEEFIIKNYFTKQELQNINTSRHSKIAISIALVTSIISILLTLFTYNKPESIDYDKLITGYEKIIELENSKLITSTSQNTLDLQNSIKDFEKSIEENNKRQFNEYEDIKINIKALKIAYEEMILKDKR